MHYWRETYLEVALNKGDICRDVRVLILIWFQTFLLFTKPHFQTFNALKSTSFQAFQIIADFLTDALTPVLGRHHTCTHTHTHTHTPIHLYTFATNRRHQFISVRECVFVTLRTHNHFLYIEQGQKFPEPMMYKLPHTSSKMISLHRPVFCLRMFHNFVCVQLGCAGQLVTITLQFRT